MNFDYYLPALTDDGETDLEQFFLNQVLMPQLCDKNNSLYKFFKTGEGLLVDKTLNETATGGKLITLSNQFGSEFETLTRTANLANRKEHIKFMQDIRPEQLAALSPYARFYVVDSKNATKANFKKNALPIAFDKSFDTDFFLKNRKTTSRGEGAGLLSIASNRVYNITGDYDPITLNSSFFFSSYEVFINKPAIEKSSLFGVSYNSNLNSAATFTGFFEKVGRVITYKELIKRSKDFKLVLEYGWNVNDGVSDLILNKKEKEIIKNLEKVHYLLSPKTHKINFNPDGSFTLDVEYVPAPLETFEKPFKTGIVNLAGSEDNLAEIKKLQEIIKKLKERAADSKSKASTVKASKKKIAELRKKVKLLEQKNASQYAKSFLDLCVSRAYFNSYTADVKFKKDTGEYNVELTMKTPWTGVVTKKFTKTYSPSRIHKSLLKKEGPDKQIFSDKSTQRGSAEEIEKKKLEDVLGVTELCLRPNDKQKVQDKEFIFLKDILKALYVINKSSDNNDEEDPLPYFILGNFALSLTTGEKLWCNVGDMALTRDNFLISLVGFFKAYPTPTIKQFISYFISQVMPKKMSTKKNMPAFPTLAFPFIHFNSPKYEKDITTNKDLLTDLAEGNSKILKDFSKKYFNESDFESSHGCFFIGQSANILYENSNIFISDKLKAFSDINYFKKDEDIVDQGVSKMILGSPVGLVQKLNFTSNSDTTITNLAYTLNQKKPGVADDLISTNFQYSLNAQLFGNRIYEFTNLIYVPSYTLGKGNPSVPDRELTDADKQRLREQAKTNDFEIGGLYVITNTTDTLQLSQGTYVKTINASCVLRDSKRLLDALKNASETEKNVLKPSYTAKFVTLESYLERNIGLISLKTRQSKGKKDED